MIQILKHGASEAAKTEADRKVRQTVEAILDDIAARGDAAVRELSAKFDKWEPASFRLSDTEIRDLIASLPDQVIEDIKFAQSQIRRFAEAQRAALRDIGRRKPRRMGDRDDALVVRPAAAPAAFGS